MDKSCQKKMLSSLPEDERNSENVIGDNCSRQDGSMVHCSLIRLITLPQNYMKLCTSKASTVFPGGLRRPNGKTCDGAREEKLVPRAAKC